MKKHNIHTPLAVKLFLAETQKQFGALKSEHLYAGGANECTLPIPSIFLCAIVLTVPLLETSFSTKVWAKKMHLLKLM